MWPMLTCSISTWIVPVLRAYLRSMPAVASQACGQCGSVFVVRVEDGTSFCAVTIEWRGSNRLRCNVRLVLTDDGKLSIFDACEPSKAAASPIPSGGIDGTSCIDTNSEADYWRARGLTSDANGQSCGCDPGAHWICEQHTPDFVHFTNQRRT